jgi:hypothetical protein
VVLDTLVVGGALVVDAVPVDVVSVAGVEVDDDVEDDVARLPHAASNITIESAPPIAPRVCSLCTPPSWARAASRCRAIRP